LAALGSALGKAKQIKKGQALARRLQQLCPSCRDAGAIELMQAAMYGAVEAYGRAAEHYLNIVKASPFPARMYPFFRSGVNCLRHARSRRYKAEVDDYLRRIDRVGELVPPVLYDAGEHYLQSRSAAALGVRRRLRERYPASGARDRMDELFERYRRSARQR
jgi:hypothetical protein